jgi:hypothetical protein
MPRAPSTSPATNALAPAIWLGLVVIGAARWILEILLICTVDSLGGSAGMGSALFYALLVPRYLRQSLETGSIRPPRLKTPRARHPRARRCAAAQHPRS